MRVTYHNGRTNKFGVYSPKHNDRNFDVTQAEHITEDKANQNIYWHCFQDDNPTMDFAQAEMQYYKAHFEDYLAVRNAKSIKQGHADRIQTIEDYHKSRKSCPEETIYQVGDVTKSISKAQLAEIFAQYNQWQKEHYPQVVTLNWAYHADEQGAGHIQERHVWIAHDKEGRAMVNQGEALKEMGVERPEPDKKEGRYNNAKMTYTQMARQKLVDLCRSHGIEIEDKPKEPSKTGKDLIEWQAEQDRLKAEEAKAELQKANQEHLEKINRAEVYLAELAEETEEIKILANKEKARASKNKNRADKAERRVEEAEKLNHDLGVIEKIKKDNIVQLEAEYAQKEKKLKDITELENARLVEWQLADVERQRQENEQIQRLKEVQAETEKEKNRAETIKALADENLRVAQKAIADLNNEYKSKLTEAERQRDKIIQKAKQDAIKERELILKPIKNEIIPALVAVDTAMQKKQNLEGAVVRLWGATKSIINALPDYFRQDEIEKNANATLHRLGDAELAETGDKAERAYKEMWRDM